MSKASIHLPGGAVIRGNPADPSFRLLVAELVGSPRAPPPEAAWPFADPHQDGDVRVERYLDPKHAPKRAGDQPPRRAAV